MGIDHPRLNARLLRALVAPATLSVLGRRLAVRRDQLLAACEQLAREGLLALEGELVSPEQSRPSDAAQARGSERPSEVPRALLAEARRLVSLRPAPLRERDQFHITADDLARRADLLLDLDDVDGRDVLFVGDDDFCSALVATLGTPRRVVVVDSDERVLEVLERAAASATVTPELVHYDLRRLVGEDPPASLTGAFDTFVTDPPYTESGMMLFLTCGLLALRPTPDVRAVVAVPWLEREEWSHEILLKVQRALVMQGFVLTDVRRAFHCYPEADHIFSSLVRAVAISGRRTPRDLLNHYDETKLYASRRWSLPTGSHHDC